VNFLSDFTPTVRSAAAKKKGSKTGVIVGVVVGGAVLGLAALAGIIFWIQKRRKLSLEQEGMGYTRINLYSN
jgi:prepilin signal peptidase PulO-like enzyme (type II secretory pathway)